MSNVVSLRPVKAEDETDVGTNIAQFAGQLAHLSRRVAGLPIDGETRAATMIGLCDATLALKRAAEALEAGLLKQIAITRRTRP